MIRAESNKRLGMSQTGEWERELVVSCARAPRTLGRGVYLVAKIVVIGSGSNKFSLVHGACAQ